MLVRLESRHVSEPIGSFDDATRRGASATAQENADVSGSNPFIFSKRERGFERPSVSVREKSPAQPVTGFPALRG